MGVVGWKRAYAVLMIALSAILLARTTAAFSIAEPSHVCHCDAAAGHGACGCSICFPKLRDHEAPRTDPTVKTQCGDPAAGVEVAGDPFVAPSAVVVGVTPSAGDLPPLPERIPSWLARVPEPRPPRAA